MKKLYYVVQKELEFNGGMNEEATGNKSIYIYDIIDNTPTLLGSIDTENEKDSLDVMSDYLDSKGIIDSVEFIEL